MRLRSWNRCWLWALLALLLCMSKGFAEEPSPDLRVMSFNIRNGHANDGANKWERRKDLVYDVIRDVSADVLGLQEAVRFQMDALAEKFPEYGAVGIGSNGGSEGQYSAILYRKKRFALRGSGNFWLSKTPEQPSRDWGSAHVRLCTWAELIDQHTGKRFYVYNTHMDDGSQEAREQGAHLIMEHIAVQEPSAPFVLMGDFNAAEDNAALALMKGSGEGRAPWQAVDTFRVLHPDATEVGTFNGFEGNADGPKIDYILVSPEFQTKDASILHTNRDGRYPSDHFPVTATLRLGEAVQLIGTRPADCRP